MINEQDISFNVYSISPYIRTSKVKLGYFSTSFLYSLLQQAYNAAVAINHMKKLQLAHSEQVLRQASIPDIRVIDVSSPTKNRKHLDPDKVEPKVPEVNGSVQGTHHMSLPSSHVELKSHCHPLKTSQSHCGAQHTPTIAEQGKHVYHSEPANLNGFVAVLYQIVTFDLLSL